MVTEKQEQAGITDLVEAVIQGFQEDGKEDPEREAYANELFQEAIRIGMEL